MRRNSKQLQRPEVLNTVGFVVIFLVLWAKLRTEEKWMRPYLSDRGVTIPPARAKSKVVVAVARKLAVLLHRLLTTQEQYMPFYEQAA